MKELLEALTVVFHGVFVKWFPEFLKMTTGAIGEFIDAFGYVKTIIIGIFALMPVGIGIIKRWSNR